MILSGALTSWSAIHPTRPLSTVLQTVMCKKQCTAILVCIEQQVRKAASRTHDRVLPVSGGAQIGPVSSQKTEIVELRLAQSTATHTSLDLYGSASEHILCCDYEGTTIDNYSFVYHYHNNILIMQVDKPAMPYDQRVRSSCP